jgi:hypothetical protein
VIGSGDQVVTTTEAGGSVAGSDGQSPDVHASGDAQIDSVQTPEQAVIAQPPDGSEVADAATADVPASGVSPVAADSPNARAESDNSSADNPSDGSSTVDG